jgi:hypothetical protein
VLKDQIARLNNPVSENGAAGDAAFDLARTCKKPKISFSDYRSARLAVPV